jgi:alpha,alpha-trehalase
MRNILRSAARGKRLLLFLDYDGTLVPIKKTPELAILRPSRRRILEQLSLRAFVGIVSGRSLTDILQQVAIPSGAYIGNHGFEISYRNRSWVHPGAKRRGKALKNVLDQLRLMTKNMSGVIVEDKGFTGSIHFRLLAAARLPELREIVRHEVRRRDRDLILTEGKKVFEIRPRVDWDKGRGVLELCRWLGIGLSDLPVYIGDDTTDEDAFRAIARRGVTILVGRNQSVHARYRLGDVNAIWKLPRLLLAILPAQRPEVKGGQRLMKDGQGRRPFPGGLGRLDSGLRMP